MHPRPGRGRVQSVSVSGVVWVLGSGFSKPLGGPLLADLLSPTLRRELHLGYKFPVRKNVDAAFELFSFEGRMPWAHAEDFLAYLDSATTSPVKQGVVEELLSSPAPGGLGRGTTAEEVLVAARQVIAAQCDFANVANLESESWAPYLRWARQLNDDDAIISFNYDLVLETIGKARDVPAIGEPTVQGLPEALVRASGCVPIYKLHGSIDWEELPTGDLRRFPEPLSTRLERAGRIALAAPGPAKRRAVAGPFARIWKDALEHLRHAEAVVFIGYRFPPSDSESLLRLTDAIKRAGGPKKVRYHVVLGPGPDPAIDRLEGILEHTTRMNSSAEVVVHPLFAQDFMTVVQRAELLE